MVGRSALWSCLGLLLISLVEPAIMSCLVRAKYDPLVHDDPLAHKVKSTWRAQDGESAEKIIANVSKVAHFVPRMWGVARGANGTEYVLFSWTRHADNRSHEEYAITWKTAPDGTIKIDSPYAKPIEIGWRAFALSLIADEIKDSEKDVNRRFLHDQANFNFVTTVQGKLGDLLRLGCCTIVDSVGVDYSPKVNEEQTTKGDSWCVVLLVNCNIPGPDFCIRHGVIAFEKREGQDWEAKSFFATRIAAFPPGSWFDCIEPNEHEGYTDGEKAQKASTNERREQLRGAAH
ncbi:nodulate formation efficiency C protein [Bradyrhizobium pachyrhizi]|uniref:Nodulate formation efficiency C protein n=1 Tax=Bradyrhizobium pachyrhizi TaxID=280333 RepID=A0A844SW71_9BRAD|nr:nodulate formation efficiency C protein [Bradyrhizobium pachyrhizi]MVT70256.1 nodulate formation efficiency C protein [Bradyrhizobium pachyrhizi]